MASILVMVLSLLCLLMAEGRQGSHRLGVNACEDPLSLHSPIKKNLLINIYFVENLQTHSIRLTTEHMKFEV